MDGWMKNMTKLRAIGKRYNYETPVFNTIACSSIFSNLIGKDLDKSKGGLPRINPQEASKYRVKNRGKS